VTSLPTAASTQLGPLLKSLGFKHGDVADATGKSPFPGNINQLVFNLKTYTETLARTGGVMGEFVNPKYKDDARVEFKKPTRLECMMQDFAKTMHEGTKVGFTTSASWIGYSPAKNSIAEGLKKIRAGVAPMCPASAEHDIYNATAEIFRRHGCQIEMPRPCDFQGVLVQLGPRISISPNFAVSRAELERVIPSPEQVRISSRSALVIQGEGTVIIESLDLDGALVVTVAKGGTLRIRNLRVRNRSWDYHALSKAEMSTEEEIYTIRGYKLARHETATIAVQEEGCFATRRMDVRSGKVSDLFRVDWSTVESGGYYLAAGMVLAAAGIAGYLLTKKRSL